MINCPKCQVPNPDSANVCAACGTALVGQQFAQALDEAAAPTQPAPEAVAPTQPAPEAPAVGAAPVSAPEPVAPAQTPFPMGQAMDPSAAQAEINQFVAEDRSRRRTKKLIYLAIFAAIASVVGFFWWKSHVRELKEQQVAEFFQAFRKIDDGQGAAFWQCTVRARDRDVRLAASSDEVTNGLEKAFANFPKSQPGRIKDKCIPMITGILADLGKLKPPEGFAGPMEDFKTSMKKLSDVFMTYANKIDKRKQEAIVEQEIRNAHKDFHTLMSGGGGGLAPVQDTPKAVMYYNIMKCVIPDFDKVVRKLTKPPDSQPIVDLYHECKKDPEFANKIRRECYAKRNENPMRSPEFRAAANKMSGDDRDLNAINYCFKKVNHGFAFEELKAIAEAFGKYRNEARANILKAVQKVKEELSE
jgi:hypothetical protein